MKGVVVLQAGNHSLSSLTSRLAQSGTQLVCIRVVDGVSVYPELHGYFDQLRAAGMVCGAMGTLSLREPYREAAAISEAIDRYEPDFFILHFDQQHIADAFVEAFDAHGCRIGLCVHGLPSLHRELSYGQLARICQFAAPKVHLRGEDAGVQFDRVLREVRKVLPDVPVTKMLVSAEKVKDMVEFYTECQERSLDMLLWSYEHTLLHRDVWRAYSKLGCPAQRARVLAMRAVVRSTPCHCGHVVGYLKHGSVVEVFDIENDWANIGEGWVKVSKLDL